MHINPSAAVVQALAALPVQGTAQPQARGQLPQAGKQIETLRQAQPPRPAVEGTPRTDLPRGSLLDIRV